MESWEFQHKLEQIKWEWGVLAAKLQEGRALTPKEVEREVQLRTLIMKFV